MNEAKGVPKKLVTKQNYTSLVHSTLKLFNAIPIQSAVKRNPTKAQLAKTLEFGLVIPPQVYGNYSASQIESLLEQITNESGLSSLQMNSTFHKSWKKVRDAPYYQLLVEQLYHYMTTYGFENMGVYTPEGVYIPRERLDVPHLVDGVKLQVIKAYTKKQLKEKLLKILESGIALKNLDDITAVAKFCELSDDEVLSIKNREVKIRLYDTLDIIPRDPVEFLRYVLFKTTTKSLILTNVKTIEAIKASTVDVTPLFRKYDKIAGYKRLAETFLRFKRLYLAFKHNGNLSRDINIIARLAPKYHKPLQQPLMNTITGLIKQGKRIDMKRLDAELKESNIFRKVRLLSALNYRLTESSDILYRVRNGRSYATTMIVGDINKVEKIRDVVLKSIVKNLKHLKGKKIYIPSRINYALPATEKQFTGNIPNGSFVTVNKDMIFGIHWFNHNNSTTHNSEYGYYNNLDRVDVDLSVISITGGKLGWDGRFRSSNLKFSGDITDAPHPEGATEMFYIDKNFDDVMLLYANYFNYTEKPVPIKLIVASEHPRAWHANYMVDPNHIQCMARTELRDKQTMLGIIVASNDECKFYFSEAALGDTISSSGGGYSDIARRYLTTLVTNAVMLEDVLEMAGAKIIREPTKTAIDLSPEVIEKDTFINLLTPKP